jgi:hypothetical protein
MDTPSSSIPEVLMTLHEHDVLVCVEGIFHWSNGNSKLCELIQQYRAAYEMSSEGQHGVVLHILWTIQGRGGRFLSHSGQALVMVHDEVAIGFIKGCFTTLAASMRWIDEQTVLQALSLVLPTENGTSAAFDSATYRYLSLQQAVEASRSMYQAVSGLCRQLVLADRQYTITQSVVGLLQLPPGAESNDPVVQTMRHVPEIYLEILPLLNHPEGPSFSSFSEEDLMLLLQAQALADASNDVVQLGQIHQVLSIVLQNDFRHDLRPDSLTYVRANLLNLHTMIHRNRQTLGDTDSPEPPPVVSSSGGTQ